MKTDEEEDGAPGSAAESLALIHRQRAAVAQTVGLNPLLYYLPWGGAWLVGFGLLFLRFGPGGRVFVDLPAWLPLTTLFVLIAAASVLTVVVSVRRGRGVEGKSSWQGTAYGFAWSFAFAGVGTITGRFADLLPPAEQGLLWASACVGTTAAMYMAGSAIWLSREMFVLGAWLTVINIAGVLLGPGWHSLVIAVGGGGGLVALGFVLRHRGRRT